MRTYSLTKIYSIICATFCIIVVLSNIISAKMVILPFTDNFIIPAGLLTYPMTFLLSDLVTEIYGAPKAKFIVYTALAMNLLALAIIQITLFLPTPFEEDQKAFKAVLGLSSLRIFSSLIAYITSQIVDIQLYAWIKRYTSDKYLWLRNNGSTWISQLVDTILIDYIYLYWGMNMEMSQVLPIMLFSYGYKVFFSVANTPFYYLCVYWMRLKCR